MTSFLDIPSFPPDSAVSCHSDSFINSPARARVGSDEQGPDLSSAFASMQLEKLIIEPLEAVTRVQAFPSFLVVIDALDECKEEKATSTVLSALAAFTARGRLSPLMFFITSRPVSVVERGFHLTDLMKDTNTLVLH